MTDARMVLLTNCDVERGVLLYISDDGKIKKGDPVNDISEFPCDSRKDLEGEEIVVTSGLGQFESDSSLRPYCTVASCEHCRRV